MRAKEEPVKKGLELISTSHVIVHDADLEYFPSDIPDLFNSIPHDDKFLIHGSRTIGSKKGKHYIFIHILEIKFYH